MIIDEIEIIFISPKNGLFALADVTFNNSLRLRNIGIHKKLNNRGIRLTFPTKKLPNGQNFNFYYPINRETEKNIRKAIETRISEISNEKNNLYEKRQMFHKSSQ